MSNERPSKCVCDCGCKCNDIISDKTDMATRVLGVLDHNHNVYDSSPVSPRWIFIEEKEEIGKGVQRDIEC